MMTTLTIVLAEITIVLLVVIFVISAKAMKRRRRDQDAVNTLVISIKANQPARVEKLAGMLKDTSHLSDDDALNKANELIKKQNKFYQDAIDLYFTRNNEVLSKLDNRLEDLLDQYQGLLKVSTTDNAEVDTEAMGQLSKDIAALSKELEDLRTENATLSTQLKAAEHELDQLGREYVSAFNKPKVDKAKHENSEDSEVAEDDQAETPGSEQAVAEDADNTMTVAADDEGLNVVTEDEVEPLAVDEPAPEETATRETDEPKPQDATVDRNTQAEFDADAAMMDDSDDQNLFADLGLDELIGEQPGQHAAAGKTTENK
jgi:FtsZ-binding cell division protein ZapB